MPAAWTGVATLKPSDGRVPLDNPYLGRAAGPLAQSISDVAAAMASISRPEARDNTSLPPEDIEWTELDIDVRDARIGLHLDAGAGMPVEPEPRAAVERAATLIADHGAHVEEIDPFIDDGVLHDIDRFRRVRFWPTDEQLPDDVKACVLPYIADWVQPAASASGARALKSMPSACPPNWFWYEAIGTLDMSGQRRRVPTVDSPPMAARSVCRSPAGASRI
ncbi:MAG: amidase family protein [Rhodococcus sp. (in: high G+C Gram-positive bacteria)]